MKSRFNSCYFFFLVCFLSETNGILYPAGSMLSRFVQLLLVALSLYYAVYANICYKVPIYMKGLNLLVALYTIYGIAMLVSGETLHVSYGMTYSEVGRFDYLKYMYMAFLPIYPIYVFSKKGLLNSKNFYFFFYLLFVTAIIGYIHYQATIMLEFDREEVINNKSYVVLGLIPAMVMFIKKPRVLLTLLLISLYLVMSGMKRGAILSCIICVLWFFYSIFKSSSTKSKWSLSIIILIVIFSSYFFIEYMASSSELFSQRLDQTLNGQSSQRDDIYAWFSNHYVNEADPFKKIFGNGAYGTIKLYGIAAHNDWLEMLISNGILGLCVFLYYWYGLIKTWLQTKDSQAYMALGMIFIIYFSKTFFSMSGMTLGSALALGYFLVDQRKDNRNIIIYPT